jgi:hypothetical protein
MSVTSTRSPPSCSARLPQKSSAATTLSLPEELGEAEFDLPHPASSAAARAARARREAEARALGRMRAT